jgi:hypothetical protein
MHPSMENQTSVWMALIARSAVCEPGTGRPGGAVKMTRS